MTISTIENNQIQVLMAEMQLMKANNNNLEANLEAKIEAKIESKFEAKIEGVKTELKGVKTELKEVKTELKEVKTRLNISEKDNRDLWAHIDQQDTIIEEQAKTITYLKACVAKLESDAIKLKSRVAKLEGFSLTTYNLLRRMFNRNSYEVRVDLMDLQEDLSHDIKHDDQKVR